MSTRAAILVVCLGVLFLLPQSAGAQWQQAASPGGFPITSFVVKGPDLFVSTLTGGVFLSTDNGKSWKKTGGGLPDKTKFECLAALGSDLYIATEKTGVFLSADGGASWNPANSGLPPDASVWRLATVGTSLFAAVGPEGHITVYVSTDGGVSWKAANSGLPDAGSICFAAIGSKIFAGVFGANSKKSGGVYLSNDNGASWKSVTLGYPEIVGISDLAAIGTDLFSGALPMNRVLLSGDNGGSWTNASSGLPDSSDNFTLSGLLARGTDLFLCSDNGVYLTRDNGAHWAAINHDFPDAGISSFAANDAYLFAGTTLGQVWRLPLSDLTLAENLSDPVFTEKEWAAVMKNVPGAAIFPKEIKVAMQEGLETRQGRRDIPFTIFKCLALPAQNMPANIFLYEGHAMVRLPDKVYASKDWIYAILFFKARNADLGYAAGSAAPASKPNKAQPASQGVLESHINIFLEFRQTDETGISRVVREVYAPSQFEADSATYDPEKENWYSVGYCLRPGKYTITMAITPNNLSAAKKKAPNDLKTIGVGYIDIDLPRPESRLTSLAIMSPFLVKKIDHEGGDLMPITEAHKGLFTWGENQVVPNIDNVLSPGEWIEFSFCVIGAKPKNAPGQPYKPDLEVIYEMQNELGVPVFSLDAAKEEKAFIHERLPMKRVYTVKDDKGERSGLKDIEPGKYTLVIKVKDTVAGATVETKLPIEVR